MNSLEKYINPHILSLDPYKSARSEFDIEASQKKFIQIDANENPYLGSSYNRYPDANHQKLTKDISEFYKISPSQIVLGNGSDEIIDISLKIFCNAGDSILVPSPGYGMYGVSANTLNIKPIKYSLNKENFDIDIEEIKNKIELNTKIIFLTSPNNPTGNIISHDTLKQILEATTDKIVILDEAYIDFCYEYSALEFIKSYPNLIVSRTLSKAWGMAGLRIGMGIGNPFIIEQFKKVKPPYNISHFSLLEAEKNFRNKDFFHKQIKEINQERKRVSERLSIYSDLKIYDSKANFILIETDFAEKIYTFALENGIIIRKMTSTTHYNKAIRISIGTPKENDTVLDIFHDFFESIKI